MKAKALNRLFLPLAEIFFLVFLLQAPLFSADKTLEKGGVLPAINLPVPKDSAEKAYLGLSRKGSFKIHQIKAPVVIIEIFSMYCPVCQADAPKVNDLYHAIENNPDLKNRIKMIGIGAGNSVFEVNVFKQTYQVPFPLFPDNDFLIHKALGEVRTPYFIGIKINEDRSHRIFHTQLGDFQGPDAFLDLILNASGLR